MNLHALNLASWRPRAVFHGRHDMELWNAILSYAGQPVTLGGGSITVQFASVDKPAARIPTLLIEPESGPPFAAVISSFPFAKMFGADIDLTESEKLPAALRECLQEGVIATLWSAIPDNRMGGFRIVDSGALESVTRRIDASGWQWLSLTIEGPTPEPVAVTVGLPIETVVAAFGAAGLPPAAVANGLATLLTTDVSHTLGSVMLTVDSVDGLHSGDIVALPELPPDQILIRAGWASYAFCRADEGWMCIGRQGVDRYRLDPATHEGAAMTHVADKTTSTSLTDLGELNVVVDFDLGRLTVPLAQVQTWQPGSIVPLDPPTATDGVEVTVRANGHVVGSGDLVRIDDRIAVRLTRLTIGN